MDGRIVSLQVSQLPSCDSFSRHSARNVAKLLVYNYRIFAEPTVSIVVN